MENDVRRKVEDPELRCPRCDGTGEIDEETRSGSYGVSSRHVIGTCDDCGGSGRKPVDSSEKSNR